VIGIHNCGRFKKTLNELGFEGLSERESAAALAEVRGCDNCRRELESTTQMLKAIERAIEAAMPRGNYWDAYDARLRAKLGRPDESGEESRRLAGFIAALSVFRRPLHAALGAATLAAFLAVGIWFSAKPGPVDIPAMPVDLAVNGTGSTSVGKSYENAGSLISKVTAEKVPLRDLRPARGSRKTIAAAVISDSTGTAGSGLPPPRAIDPSGAEFASVIAFNLRGDPVVRDHLETVELLLRTIRNRPSSRLSPTDNAFQKRLANALVTNNVVLRRSARTKGDAFLEELLSQVESPLLDIAHLPRRPSARSVQIIQAALEQGQMIQMIQICASSIPRA
jgi:hypothetical protein